MESPTLGETLAQVFWFLGEVAFKWGPATVATVIGAGGTPDSASITSLTAIRSPVAVPEAIQYLQTASAPGVWDDLFYHWSVFVAISLFVSLLLIALVIYCVIRIQQIRYHERRAFAAYAKGPSIEHAPRAHVRWQRILDQLQEGSDQSIRLAVLEADIMLNELLDTLGYKGETMADKMKQVARADFHTIDIAWDAHTYRNRVAHESAATPLDKHEAERVIGLYQRVFREFRFIE